MPSSGGFCSGTLPAISATQCVQTQCIWRMCAGLEGNSFFLKIETSNARPVRVPPHLARTLPRTKLTRIIKFCFSRVMRRANEELHGTLKKARKEVTSTRRKLGEVVMKQEEKSKKTIERLKVIIFYVIYVYLAYL